jgi:hypothetical protein
MVRVSGAFPPDMARRHARIIAPASKIDSFEPIQGGK